MKKKLFFIVFISINLQAQWINVNSNTTNNLRDINFTSVNVGYIVGDNGTVIKTIDNGQTWNSIFTDSNQSFISCSFINDNVGFILTSNKLFSTNDGGITWLLKFTYSNPYLYVVYFIDENIGFLGIDNGILKTIDGGVNWTKVQTTLHKIKSISFPNQNTGYFVGGNDSSDNVYKTVNQGITFNNYVLFMQSIKERVYFINEDIGYVIGWYSPWIKKTTDGGLTWIDLYNSVNNGIGGMEVNFIDEMNGFYSDNAGGQSNLFVTSNSGQTWTPELNINTNTTYGFSKLSTKFNNGILIGENGMIYRKSNLLSVKEIKKNENDIEIFPNPTYDEITVKYNLDKTVIESITLLDLNGKVLENLNSNSTKINLQKLSKGTYFLAFKTSKDTLTKKIILK